MKRSKGFILAEILTGMILQAGFILVLCGAFYLLVSFSSGTQQILTARERGQRVIAYFDSRIRNAGLGLWRMKHSSTYRTVLSEFTDSDNKPLYCKKDSTHDGLRLPVAITNLQANEDEPTEAQYRTQANPNNYRNESGNQIQRGDTLTILYAQRDFDTGAYAKNFTILNTSIPDTETTDYVAQYEFLSGKNEYKDSKFSKETDAKKRKKDIRSYAVMAGAGELLSIDTVPNDKTIKLKTVTNPTSVDQVIISGDELLYLKCERLFVYPDTGSEKERNFKFQILKVNDKGEAVWGDREPHEKEILEIYMELNRTTNVFNLWVLASGGKDSRVHECPKSWPTKKNTDNKSIARWKDEYKYHVVYVSKASWKLHNLNGFTWD